MKSFKEVVITFIFIVLFQLTFSQTGVGQWSDHLPYNSANSVTESPDKIYASTGEAVYSYDKNTGETQKLNKVNYLSDIGVSFINYSKNQNTLIIGYKNGNIDILKNNIVTNISDIKRKSFSAGKSINHISFIDDYAVLSTGFGIVLLDINRQEIKNTYLIGDMGSYLKVYETAFDGKYLYAATEEGILKGDYYNDNLSDFNNWTEITNVSAGDSLQHLNKGKFNSLALFNDKLYTSLKSNFDDQNTIYVYDDNEWRYFADTSIKEVRRITAKDTMLCIAKPYKGFVFNEDEEESINIWGYFTGTNNPLVVDPEHIIKGDQQELLIADKKNGMIFKGNTWQYTNVKLDGPASLGAFDIAAQGEITITVPGGRNLSWGPTFTPPEINYYKNNDWSYSTSSTDTILKQIDDLSEVVINPKNKSEAFAGSWGKGLMKLNNGKPVKYFDENNSSLTEIPDIGYVRIGGLDYDDDQNLWIVNSGGTIPVHMRTPDNQWTKLDYSSQIGEFNIGQILVTSNDHKWIVLPRGKGLFAFDDNDTPENMNDDRTKKFSIKNEFGEIISNDIYSIAEDKDGNIWIGTGKGVVVYYNPEDIFDDNLYAEQILIPRNDGTNNADILLETETVTAIAVDGANKKWFGTQSGGVFKTSADGITQIHNFNKDNSPLFSNNILDLEINPESGEIFIGTNKGLLSYRGKATEGKEDYSEVYAFPNPVKPGYSGPVTIHGLVAGSVVKITDISGNLVYETRSEGGQAQWYGKDLNGNKVQSGVYLVFSANEDGTKSNVTKILFIN